LPPTRLHTAPAPPRRHHHHHPLTHTHTHTRLARSALSTHQTCWTRSTRSRLRAACRSGDARRQRRARRARGARTRCRASCAWPASRRVRRVAGLVPRHSSRGACSCASVGGAWSVRTQKHTHTHTHTHTDTHTHTHTRARAHAHASHHTTTSHHTLRPPSCAGAGPAVHAQCAQRRRVPL
jgi:hypothetical protein